MPVARASAPPSSVRRGGVPPPPSRPVDVTVSPLAPPAPPLPPMTALFLSELEDEVFIRNLARRAKPVEGKVELAYVKSETRARQEKKNINCQPPLSIFASFLGLPTTSWWHRVSKSVGSQRCDDTTMLLYLAQSIAHLKMAFLILLQMMRRQS